MPFLEWQNYLLSLKQRHFLKLFGSLISIIGQLFGYFIVEVPVTKLTDSHGRVLVFNFDQLLGTGKSLYNDHQNIQQLIW